MKKNKNKRLGPNGKQKLISSQVRKDIHAGILVPGEKIPARIDFEARYECGPVTVQNAFNKLKEDSSIVINGNKGTFVSENPPCLSTYAIVFPFDPRQLNNEISFYGTLAQLAQEDTANNRCRFKIYTNINGHKDEEDYMRLYNDVVSESLAGIVFATPPFVIEKTELFKELISKKYLPKVIMMSKADFYPNFSIIQSPDEGFIKKVFDFFESKGVERLAVVNALTSEDIRIPYEKEIFAEANKRGIELLKHNFQSRSSVYASRANEIVHLMLSRGVNERPQALWITNDTLVEGATRGILDAGLKVPDDLIVVSHCNFPENPKSSVDTSWYGLNVRTFIDTALDIMRNYSKGGNKPCVRTIPIEYYLD